MNIKTNTYLALAVLSASLLSGCDKVSTFFGKDENKELVQRIETNTDDGKVGMLLPDFAQLVQNEDRQSSIFKQHRRNALRHRMTTTAWT